MFSETMFLVNESAALYEGEAGCDEGKDIDDSGTERKGDCDIEQAAGQYEQCPYHE
jgi:hypothetical protein